MANVVLENPLVRKQFVPISIETYHELGKMQRIYAKGNMQEYWIINLQDKQVEVYKDIESSKYMYNKIFTKEFILQPELLKDWNFCLQNYLE